MADILCNAIVPVIILFALYSFGRCFLGKNYYKGERSRKVYTERGFTLQRVDAQCTPSGILPSFLCNSSKSGGLSDWHQLSGFAVHDVATNHNIIGHERMILNKVNSFKYSCFGIIKTMKP